MRPLLTDLAATSRGALATCVFALLIAAGATIPLPVAAQTVLPRAAPPAVKPRAVVHWRPGFAVAQLLEQLPAGRSTRGPHASDCHCGECPTPGAPTVNLQPERRSPVAPANMVRPVFAEELDPGYSVPEDSELSLDDHLIEGPGVFAHHPHGFQPYGLRTVPSRVWVGADLLVWWTPGMDLPPLVTTSPPNTARPDAGVLGVAGTEILFGGQELLDDARVGGRFSLGYWFDFGETLGIQVEYLTLGKESADFAAASVGEPILARPFFNVETGAQDAELVAFPNAFEGSVAVAATTEFDSFELLFRRDVCFESGHRLRFLLGYRQADLDDDLRIRQQVLSLNGVAPGTQFDLTDLFRADNTFQGATLAVAGEYQCCGVALELLLKLSLGNTRSQVVIDGSTVVDTPGGGSATSRGGLLALGTNIGSFEQDSFSVLPEIGLRARYSLNDCWRLTCGYSLIYWSQVARAGDQIDPMLNLSQLPPGPLTGAPLPAFRFATTDFWAQGFHAGAEVRY